MCGVEYSHVLQAVRSVAFSQSGQLVAVGANSKYLRLYSTSSILDDGRLVSALLEGNVCIIAGL